MRHNSLSARHGASFLMYIDSGAPQPRTGHMRFWVRQTLWTKGWNCLWPGTFSRSGSTIAPPLLIHPCPPPWTPSSYDML